MQCPRCQHENAPTMKFCGECGTPLRTANPEARVDPDAVDRRLGAILSADAVGYGGLMARDDVATLRTLTAYREQITVLVRQHQGRLVDAPGDNLLAEFSSALEATRCALEIQRVLAARNAGLPAERRMAFRVGVHLGDVLVEGDRIYGDAVNLAARLQTLAEPGGVAISGAVHEQVRDKLPAGVEDLGDQAVKNSPHPVRVYRLPVASDGPVRPPDGLAGLAGRSDVAVLVVPAAWAAYVAIVFEILFMISPFALHYYAAYGPSLNILHRWRGTAWLTDFFLPHFSDTGTLWLDGLHGAAAVLIATGAMVFGLAFLQVYGAKLANRGPVTGGLYRIIRHPQYLGLAILGLGTLLLWPRMLVLLAYLTMLALYGALARREEARCLARFGEVYRRYLQRTARFLPGRLGAGWPRLLPAAGPRRRVAALALYAATLVAGVGLAYGLRDYALARVSALYTEEAAVLSPARLTPGELRVAFEVARADDRVRQVLEAPGGSGGKLLVYVVPLGWMLPDLPLDGVPAGGHGGHVRPADFERGRYRVLFTRARTHHPESAGPAIVRTAYGREPLVVATVDTGARQVTGVATPPPHVRWGDIPTPLF